MSKISPNKLKKLIAKGRVTPVIQINDKGEHLLYGYRRSSNRSSKINENYMFAEPISLEKKQVDSNKE
jgi:hypothetical protein